MVASAIASFLPAALCALPHVDPDITPEAGTATLALPGSEAKLQLLEQRAAGRQQLFQRGDLSSADCERLGWALTTTEAMQTAWLHRDSGQLVACQGGPLS